MRIAQRQNKDYGLLAEGLLNTNGLALSKMDTTAWNKEINHQKNGVKELYNSEKSYLASLELLTEKIKDHPLVSNELRQYVMGLQKGSHCLLNQMEAHFQNPKSTEKSFKDDLNKFFNDLSSDKDFQNYLGLFEVGQFMFNEIDHSLNGVKDFSEFQTLYIQFIQRGPRYEMLLKVINPVTAKPYEVQKQIKTTINISNMDTDFSSIQDLEKNSKHKK